MNELNELKQKLKEIAELLLKVSKFYWAEGVRRFNDERYVKRNQRIALVLAGVIFVSGFFIGSAITKGPANPGDGFSIIRILFGRTFPVQGKQKDGSFVIANFEKNSDLKAIELASAKIEISNQHVKEGQKSAKLTLFGGEEVSAIRIEDYFESRNGMKNWSKYGVFHFYMFNPRNETERIILQIKDQRGQRYKQDIHIPAGQGQSFDISIERLSGSLNIRKIDQIALFRWEPKGDREFYLDDIKLLPKDYSQAESQSQTLQVQVKNRPVKVLDYGFSARKPAWLRQDAEGSAAGIVRIPFIVKNETQGFCRGCAVEGGVPFPMGELKSEENVRLVNPKGEDISLQTRILAKWPDGSIKWLALHFIAALNPLDGTGYFLEYGPTVKRSEFSSPLKVDVASDEVIIDTGAIKMKWNKKKFFLFKEVSVDSNLNGMYEADELITQDAPLILTFRGEEYRADLDDKSYKIEIEEKRTQRTVVKAIGWFQSKDRKRYCQLIVRYYLYAGKDFVKVAHTLIYTGYPANIHYYKYKEIQNKLPENETISEFGLRLPLQLTGVSRFQIGHEKMGQQEFSATEKLNLIQPDYGHSVVETSKGKQEAPDIYAGWIDVSDDRQGAMIAMRHFRENFPKAFRFDPATKTIQIDFWPKESGELDLSTTSNAEGPEDKARGNAFGLAKTHELLFYFHAQDGFKANAIHMAKSFAEPLIIRTNPYWIDATGALGRLYPVEARYATEEQMLSKLFDWAARHPRDFKWYGMLNFGDTLSWWRNEDENWYGQFGWHPIGRWGWYNCEGVGVHTGSLLQFARSGEWKYFEFGKNLARHIMDVDTVHYNTIANDDRLKHVLNDEVSQIGSMHRHSGDHWSGRNEESSHTSVLGILIYYYLTGDERAFDVAKEVGEFFLKEPFTYTEHPDVAPHRAMANALWGDVLLYSATQDERYKKAADRIIEIYLKGQQSDGSFLENYNPLDGTWSGEKHLDYMATYALGAFMSYHELTQDEEVKQMLLRMVRFLGSDSSALHGSSYAYFITGDPFFIEAVNKGLNELVGNQQHSSDSMYDGLIYKKPIYHRPNNYLFSAPFAFEALEASGDMSS